MKRLILITFMLVFGFSGCKGKATSTAQQPGSTPFPAPTGTSWPTATRTPLPTNSPTPTEVPLPTTTPIPTTTPTPEVISSQNAAQLQLVRRYGNGMIVQTLWSPDASQLLVLTTVHLKAFDPTSGDLLWEVETGSPQKEMAYRPDGKSIATLFSKDGAVKIWDAATGTLRKIAHQPQDGVDFADLSGIWECAGADEFRQRNNDLGCGKR